MSLLDALEDEPTSPVHYAAQRLFWYAMWRWLGIYAYQAKVYEGYDIPRIIGFYTMQDAQQIHQRLHGAPR